MWNHQALKKISATMKILMWTMQHGMYWNHKKRAGALFLI